MADKPKKNTYYYVLFQRRNALKEMLYDFFFGLASLPRLLIEVFIRREMGERYFSLFTALLIFVGLLVFPFVLEGRYASFKEAFGNHLLWYAFTAAFAFFSFQRWREIATLPSVFEEKRFSLSAGYTLPFLENFDGLLTHTVLEPGMVFGLGLVLLVVGQQPLGCLLLVCSVFYSMSYVAAHYRANNFILDKMDEHICSAQLHASFVEKKSPRETQGFEFVGSRPKDRATREQMADSFFEDDDAPEVR